MLAGPSSLQAASAWSSYLNYEHVYNSGREVNSPPATSLSRDGEKIRTWSLEAVWANLCSRQHVKGTCLYWPMEYICSGAACGDGEHISKYWAVVLCTVNGTLVQQLLLLCLKKLLS